MSFPDAIAALFRTGLLPEKSSKAIPKLKQAGIRS
jgi:hypothetical protein